MTPQRIAQVLLSPRIGGAETLAASLEQEWSQLGLKSQILYLEDDSASGRVDRVRGLRRSLRTYQPSVVVAHSALPNIYARLAAPASTPVITVLHSAGDDFESRSLRWAERLLSRRTAAIVAVSRAQYDRYIARFPRMRPRALIIPNGVRARLPEKLAYPEHPRRVVAVSRFAEQKNPALWLQAASSFSDHDPGMQFDWWGPLAGDVEIAQLVADTREGAANVRVCGPTNDPGRALANSDIFFHSSDREAHSVAILEAAAVGLPIICAQDVARTLPPGLAFATFRTGDAISAEQALRRTVANWDDAVQHATAARGRIREQYSSTKCASEYLELLADISADRRTLR